MTNCQPFLPAQCPASKEVAAELLFLPEIFGIFTAKWFACRLLLDLDIVVNQTLRVIKVPQFLPDLHKHVLQDLAVHMPSGGDLTQQSPELSKPPR